MPNSSSLARTGRWCVRRRHAVLTVAIFLAVPAGLLGAGVGARLQPGGLTDPGAPSARAAAVLSTRFGAGEPQVVLLAEASSSVDDPVIASAGRTLTERVRAVAGVSGVESYWSGGRPAPLRSSDGRIGLVLVRISGAAGEVAATAARVANLARAQTGGLTVRVTGQAQLDREVDAQAERDLSRAELVTAPSTLLVLVLVFGSVVAAAAPLAVGALSIVASLAVLSVIARVVDVSVFALNLTTALGLGLAIDYSLFLVNRYRAELHSGREVPDAIAVAMATAGRTVLFSAVTVALALSALLVFPGYFLRSFAYAGIAVCLLTASVALVVLPALLAVLGRRIDAFDVRRVLRRRSPAGDRQEAGTTDQARATATHAGGGWHRLALAVMRRPIPVTTATVLFLVVLASPVTRIAFGITDYRGLPSTAPGYQASQQLVARFDSRETSPTPVVLDGRVPDAALARYARALSSLPAVVRTDTATGSYRDGRRQVAPSAEAVRFRAPDGSAWLSVVADVEPISADGSRLVLRIRGVRAPAPALVGGAAASLVDTREAIGDRLGWAVLLVVVTTSLLLFALTGSVLLPVKAIALAGLSLTATFGAMVYVFQEGHLQGLVGGFTVTGWVDVSAPVLMFCVAYGLAMDYEVFLLSRIKEEYDVSGNNTDAVADGLERTGRLITAAALLVAVVLGALATSQITYLKMLGVGLTLAVLVDAFVVRALLVPALMRLLGDANWWAPGPLLRLHRRIRVRE